MPSGPHIALAPSVTTRPLLRAFRRFSPVCCLADSPVYPLWQLLAKCHMQREHITVLLAKLTELLKFMQANKSKYFVNDYIHPGEEYLRWWSNE